LIANVPVFVVDENHLLDLAAIVGNAYSRLVDLICIGIFAASA
jgi:hypothetical protein